VKEWLHGLGSPWGGALAAFALVLAAYALGDLWLLRRPRAGLRHPVDRALVALVLGLNLIALGVLLVGSVRLPGAWILRLLLVAGAGWGGCVAWRRAPLPRRRDWRVWGIVLLIALPPLGKALTYPMGWDELTYHLALPARWLADGQIRFYADNAYSGLASGVEMLFAIVQGAGGVTAHGSLNYLVWLVLGALVYRLLRRRLSPLPALGLCFAFLYSDVLLMLVMEAYVMPFLLANLAAILLLWRPRTDSRTDWLTLAVLGGLATGWKLIGAMFLPTLAVMTGLAWWGGKRPRPWRAWAIALAAAVIVAAPFYLRPWLATGDPFYPYYARWFTPGNPAAVEVSTYHHALATAKFGRAGWGECLQTLPWLAWQRLRFDGSFGWQWLAILALAAWGLRRFRRGRALLLGAGLLYLAWFATAQQARFLAPAIVVILLVAAEGLRGQRPAWRNAFAVALIVATLASLRAYDWERFRNPYRVLTGSVSLETQIASHCGFAYLREADAISALTPPDATVMLLWDPRSLYIPRRTVIGTPFFQQRYFSPVPADLTPDALLHALQTQHIDYVLFAPSKLDPDRLAAYVARCVPLVDALQALATRGTLKIASQADGYFLLAVPKAESVRAGGP